MKRHARVFLNQYFPSLRQFIEHQSHPLINHHLAIPNMITIPRPLCPKHSLPLSHICSFKSCQEPARLCFSCLSNHNDHLINVEPQGLVGQRIWRNLMRFLKDVKKVRQVAPSKTSNQEKYVADQKKVIENLTVCLKTEQDFIANVLKIMSDRQKKLASQMCLVNYVSQLANHNLMDLRIQHSSRAGLVNIKRVFMKHKELTGNQQELKEIHRFTSDCHRLKDLMEAVTSKMWTVDVQKELKLVELLKIPKKLQQRQEIPPENRVDRRDSKSKEKISLKRHPSPNALEEIPSLQQISRKRQLSQVKQDKHSYQPLTPRGMKGYY